VVTGCDELGGATHGELPSCLRRRRSGYGATSSEGDATQRYEAVGGAESGVGGG
jgi:hypothetical protein